MARQTSAAEPVLLHGVAEPFVPQDPLEREIFNALKKVRLSRKQKAKYAEKFKSDLEIRRRVLSGTETLSDRMYLDQLVGQKR